jgi:DNA mismatch endonuclease (patch repair protein)
MEENKNRSLLPVRYIFDTTPERSKLMSKIKSKNTQPELLLRKALWQEGIRYRLHVKKLPGRPDIVIGKAKLAIFVDGDFWHGHDWDNKKLKLKSNINYWIPKIEKNIQRDIQNNKDLDSVGYLVLRFWEHQIKKETAICISKILRIIKNSETINL